MGVRKAICHCMGLAFVVVSSLTSCGKDNDSELATLCAEVCYVNTGQAGVVLSSMMDDDRTLSFTQPLTAKWAATPDSTYRALLYYKMSGSTTVDAITAVSALNLCPRTKQELKELYEQRDPLQLTSAWMAENRRNLNMLLRVKSGYMDESRPHVMAVVCDTVCESETGRRHYYSICHSQNGVPADYGVDVYASIPTDDIGVGDTLTLTVPTWNGVVTRDFVK